MIQICIVQDEFGFVLDDNGFGGWQIGTMEQVAMRANVSSVPPTICHPPSTVANTFLFWQLLLGNRLFGALHIIPLLKRILDLFLE